MSILANPLATPVPLHHRLSSPIPASLQDVIFHATCKLTFAAGLLLELPLSVTSSACVVYARYYLSLIGRSESGLLDDEPADVSAAAVYAVAKTSSHPVSCGSVANVYAYLGTVGLDGGRGGGGGEGRRGNGAGNDGDAEQEEQEMAQGRKWYKTDAENMSFQSRIVSIEPKLLAALGFDLRVALPHPLAITYLQAMDFMALPSSPSSTAASPATRESLARRTIQYLNTALLSPQLLYLTHSPPALAVAAIYVAAKDERAKMPECSWWEVFDVEREELGFLVVGMRSLEGWVRRMGMGMAVGVEKDDDRLVAAEDHVDEDWSVPGYGQRVLTREDVYGVLRLKGLLVEEEERGHEHDHKHGMLRNGTVS